MRQFEGFPQPVFTRVEKLPFEDKTEENRTLTDVIEIHRHAQARAHTQRRACARAHTHTHTHTHTNTHTHKITQSEIIFQLRKIPHSTVGKPDLPSQ